MCLEGLVGCYGYERCGRFEIFLEKDPWSVILKELL